LQYAALKRAILSVLHVWCNEHCDGLSGLGADAKDSFGISVEAKGSILLSGHFGGFFDNNFIIALLVCYCLVAAVAAHN